MLAPVGYRLPERVFGPITRMTIARFSVAFADPNLVHIDDEVARSAGLKGIIASAGLVMGVMDDVITAWAGLGAIRSANRTFKAPVLPGQIISVIGEVTDPHRDAPAPTITVTVTATDDTGQCIAIGEYDVSYHPANG